MSKKSLIFLLCFTILFSGIFFIKTPNTTRKDTKASTPRLIVIPNSNIIEKNINIIENEQITSRIHNNYIPLNNAEITRIENFKKYLIGKFNPEERNDIVLVEKYYAPLVNNVYLRKEVYESFIAMEKEALKEEVDLKIISGLRNFDYQKGIWNGKWNGTIFANGKNLKKTIPDELQRTKEILKYSAMPGTSRHHWGTEIDLNNTDAFYFDSEKGKKEYDWMVNNASKFGFYQPYNKKDEINTRTGYSEEKWHWSYLPISRELTNNYISLITENDIKGFLGDQFVPKINIIGDYVLGINSNCI